MAGQKLKIHGLGQKLKKHGWVKAEEYKRRPHIESPHGAAARGKILFFDKSVEIHFVQSLGLSFDTVFHDLG